VLCINTRYEHLRVRSSLLSQLSPAITHPRAHTHTVMGGLIWA
jgi:hypothetical protein